MTERQSLAVPGDAEPTTHRSRPPGPPATAERFDVFGVSVSAVDLQQTVAIIESWIAEGRRDYVVLTGAHGVVEMQDDELREINNRSGLTTPDGMPVVWIGRWRGHENVEKVYAPNIMLAMFGVGAVKGYRNYFYGGKEGVAEALAQAMQQRFPGLNVCGTYCPPFRPLTSTEEAEIAAEIDAAEPDIVWVGLGCPKQERWMDRFRPSLRAPVLIGVGAGFDFLSGAMPWAPRWLQHSGFEWAFRLVTDPKRLWPRYSRVVPRFLMLAAAHLIKGRGGRGAKGV